MIRRFGEHLDVEPDKTDPDVVSLFLRVGRRDAAHARVDALEEDARRWVRQRLTTLPEVAPLPLAPLPSSPDERQNLLAQGQEALSQYDYEEARQRLLRAIATRKP